MAKLMWKLTRPESASSWARWARINLIKGRSLWDIPIPKDCSWTWRRILSLRNSFRSNFRSLVGNGKSVSLWSDFWLPIGPLLSTIGDHLIAATGLSRSAKVAEIIRNGQWRWLWTSTEELQGIKQLILQPIPCSHERDAVIWALDQSGTFSIRSAWESIRTHRNHVEWYKLIWFPGRIPKIAFCLWLAVRGRLGTQDRLPTFDPNMKCFFCKHFVEDHNHLFFSCSVTS